MHTLVQIIKWLAIFSFSLSLSDFLLFLIPDLVKPIFEIWPEILVLRFTIPPKVFNKILTRTNRRETPKFNISSTVSIFTFDANIFIRNLPSFWKATFHVFVLIFRLISWKMEQTIRSSISSPLKLFTYGKWMCPLYGLVLSTFLSNPGQTVPNIVSFIIYNRNNIRFLFD